ncbi:MAG: iron-containing alcohol dehydrogenase [Geminicoccaceae bacterium]|nr:MAG: iron-containing alcohol dehydrogenase [Geminicoccaceae bacterium]
MPTISYLTTIQFDFGAVAGVRDACQSLGITRPLIVTDQGVVQAGLLQRITDRLGNVIAADVFDDTPANPTEAACRLCAERYVESGADGIIALGGGSAMDLAKTAGLLAAQGGKAGDYAMVEGGVARIRPDQPPLIAIPTTAGTGSEVGRGAVVVLDDGRKLALVSPHLIPKLAIVDPELTLDLPPLLTAGTGMDAISHCIETFTAPSHNPPAEAIAMDGLYRAVRALPRAVADGHDRAARFDMAMAAMEGAMAFQKGLGAIHALAHPLGAFEELRLHHGTLNAVLMPEVLRFNAPAIQPRLRRLRQVIGLAEDADLAAWAERFTAALGLPTTLRAMGVPEAVLDGVAEAATKDHTHATNARPATADDYRRILRASYG